MSPVGGLCDAYQKNTLLAFHADVSYLRAMTSRIAFFADPGRWGTQLFFTGMIGIFLVAGSGPRHTRALFLTDGAPLAAKAFVATVPSLNSQRSDRGQDAVGSLAGARQANAVGSLADARQANALGTRTGAPGTARPGVPDLIPLAVGPTSDSFIGAPGTAIAALSTGPGGGAPSIAPTSPGSSFVSPPPSPLAGAPSPTATPVNPTEPTQPTQPVDPVSAVPEPNTWAMMILGFFAIGMAVRSRAAKNSVRARLGLSS